MFENGGQAQADLRWVLPLRAGETIWIYGKMPALEESLKAAALKFRRVDADHFAPMVADHLLAPVVSAGELEMLIGLGKQALRPGGYALFGVYNAAFLGALIGRSSPGGARLTSIVQRLQAAGFSVRSIFGTFYSLTEPRFLVSLETRQPSRYFWERLYLPPSRFALWKQRLALLLTALGWQERLYSAFVLTAQRV